MITLPFYWYTFSNDDGVSIIIFKCKKERHMMKCSLQKIVIVAIAIVFAGICNTVYAEEGYASPIEQMIYQGIPYVSGGVGLEEREALAAKYGNYNLKLMFAAKGGEYLADIKVEISDSRGKKVLVATADGPWFFTNLPQGKYTVTVTTMGKEQQNKVTIGKGQKQTTLRFYWTPVR
jgi:hypothetical protein